MVKVIKGELKSSGQKFAVVVSEFNDFITKRLLDGCLIELRKLGVKDNQITVIWVPGSFEIPSVALKLAKKKSVDAVICLGAVIQGETLHYDLVAHGAAQGIMQVSVMTGKPIIFEILATDTVEKAYQRAGRKGPNKGVSAARCAVAMVNVLRRI